MATFSKRTLSESGGGFAVKIASTSSAAGTLIHSTAVPSTTIDEVHLFATNTDAVAVVLTVQFGFTGSGSHDVFLSIPAKSGLTYVIPGLPLTGNDSVARTVYAYAGTANKINVFGYVNRITP